MIASRNARPRIAISTAGGAIWGSSLKVSPQPSRTLAPRPTTPHLQNAAAHPPAINKWYVPYPCTTLHETRAPLDGGSTAPCASMLQAVAMASTLWFTTQRHTFVKARAGGVRSVVCRGSGGGDGARESELSGETSGLLDCVCSRAWVHAVGSQSLDSASRGQAAGNPVYRYLSHSADESLAADRPSPGAPTPGDIGRSTKGPDGDPSPSSPCPPQLPGQQGASYQCQPRRKRRGQLHLPADHAQNLQSAISSGA
jgi:hypothetical protein